MTTRWWTARRSGLERQALVPTVLLARLLLTTLLLVVAGCSSIKVSNRDEYRGPALARPEHVWVHDFAATVEDLPAWSDAAKTNAGAAAKATPKEVEAGRQLGVGMTGSLVKRIDAMGLDAERATSSTTPRPGDIVIVGYLASVDEGSGFKRVVVGFGSGAAQITTHVEGYLATEKGLEKLGSGDASSTKSRGPGVVVPLAVTIATANPIGLLVMAPIKVGTELSGRNTAEGVGDRMAAEIADVLEKKFREQGWLKR